MISSLRHWNWRFYGLGIALILAALLAFGTTLKWRGAGVLRAVLFTGASAPMFLLGILGLIVFYQKLGWVPANGRISVAESADRADRAADGRRAAGRSIRRRRRTHCTT